MPPDDRDDQRPKAGRLWDRPSSQPAHSTAVPVATYDDVTGQHFVTPEAEAEARWRRDVMRMLRAQNIKTGAIGKYVRDEFRKSSEERERRRAAEDKAAERRHRTVQRIVGALTSGKFWTAIGAAVAGVLTALKATGRL